MHPSEFGTPGKVPPVLTGNGQVVPPFEQWDPEGDILAPIAGAETGYVPTIVRAPPQLPRPEQHPRQAEYVPRGYERFFTLTPGNLDHQLGFTAASARVDNYSSHWLFFPSAGMWVPPYFYGVVLQMYPGVAVAQFELRAPQGYVDPTPAVDTTVLTIWYEHALAPNSGSALPASFRGGAGGGALTLNQTLLFAPDNTYDIGASGANRPRTIYVADHIALGAVPTNILAGNGVPSVAVGNNGDFYLRSDGAAGSCLYQKRSGAWVTTAA